MVAETVFPKLSKDVLVRELGPDERLVQHQTQRTQLALSASEALAVSAMDGTTSLEDLEALLFEERGGLAYRDLAILLFRLWDRGLLANGDEIRAALFPHHEERTFDQAVAWRRLRSIFGFSLMGASLARLLTGTLTLGAQIVLAVVVLGSLIAGSTPWPDNLFQLNGDWISGIVSAYVSLVGLLSIRGLIRMAILAGAGSGVRQMGLRVTAGIPYIDVDDRDAYHLSPSLQLRFALAGLLGPMSLAGLLVLSGIAGAVPWAAQLCALAVLLAFVDLCPFFPTNGSLLLEHLAGLPKQRFRVRTFILRELVRGLVSPALRGEAGMRFSLVATAWFVWFFAAIRVMTEVTLDQMTALQHMVVVTSDHVDSQFMAVICGLLLAYLVALMVLMVGAMAVVSIDLLGQVFRPRRADAPSAQRGAAALPDEEREKLVDTVRTLALAEALPSETLVDMMSGVDELQFEQGAWIVRAGQADVQFFWILSGRVDLLRPQPEGGHVLVASLGAGESLGVEALTGDALEHDARAAENCVLLSLGGDFLAQALGGEGEATEPIRALVSRASFLGGLPEFSALGPAGRLDLAGRVMERDVEPGVAVVQEGGQSDSMYLIRSGKVRVTREDNGQEVVLAELGPGDTFGEMGLLYKRPRSATVSSIESSSLVEVPRDVLEDLLRRSFHVGLALESLAAAREAQA
ncbi:MAG TPA: hypothetical protein DIU15_12075 [Deltaproteobacteria bacterium]|nr:hypothetical protein [Deltaproteobacteria bacterium]HCP46775.1 hypothetical protein [Deltaproteobacteria bacterium]